VSGEWALTSRPSPEVLHQPHSPRGRAVTTIGEAGTDRHVYRNPKAVVVTAATRDGSTGGTIPWRDPTLPLYLVVDEPGQLGCEPDFDGLGLHGGEARRAICNGVWCGQVTDRDPQYGQRRIPRRPHLLLSRRHASLAPACLTCDGGEYGPKTDNVRHSAR